MTIKPFRPHAFPPRRLRKSAFARTLKTANILLAKYNAFLQKVPRRLFSGLIDLESIASVHSQHVKVDLEDFLRDRKKPKFRLVKNYREALVWAIKHPVISKELICTVQKKTKYKTTLPIDAGSYRNRQNWIGPEGCMIDEAYFYPPAASDVEGLMRELLRYAKTKEKEPLIQLALFFAQLLIIHPFMDGNGRVARILVPVFLYQKKVLPFPLLFMSRYFQKYRLKYFQKLFQLRESNQWEDWILFFLRGIIVEARQTQKMLDQILDLNHKSSKTLPLLRILKKYKKY